METLLRCSQERSLLDVEQEVDDVAVFHDVFFAFAADFALGFGVGHGAEGLQVFEGDDLGTDEATLEVGVDLAGGLGGLGAGTRRSRR